MMENEASSTSLAKLERDPSRPTWSELRVGEQVEGLPGGASPKIAREHRSGAASGECRSSHALLWASEGQCGASVWARRELGI